MEQIFFASTGIIIILLTLWAGSALYRVRRSPETVLKRWQQLTTDDLKRLSFLCELFFKEELHLQLNRENLHNSIPALLQFFPDGICRLQGYLFWRNSSAGKREKNPTFCRCYRKGEYFYGFSSILLSCFIGEALRNSCGAEWVQGPCGLQLSFHANRGRDITVSPVEKLAALHNISTSAEKEQFEEYLLELCTLACKNPKYTKDF